MKRGKATLKAVAFCATLGLTSLALPAPAGAAVKAVNDNPKLAGCISRAASHYDLPEPLVWLILDVEGGVEGTVSRNTNGTEDLGPMQINTIWLPEIQSAYDEPVEKLKARLVNDGCFNIAMGTWILRLSIDSAGGDIWRGIAWYHSRTPSHAHRYLDRVLKTAERWYGKKIDAEINF